MPSCIDSILSRLYIGGVPSPSELAHFQKLGVCYWVNVGGVDIHAIYAQELSFVKSIDQFFFTDIFSSYQTASTHRTTRPHVPETGELTLYEKHTTHHERTQFLKATYTVFERLQHQQRIHLFCYTGQGRSPTVALAALYWLTAEPLPNIINVIRQYYPQARITAMSTAAARWSYQQYIAHAN